MNEIFLSRNLPKIKKLFLRNQKKNKKNRYENTQNIPIFFPLNRNCV